MAWPRSQSMAIGHNVPSAVAQTHDAIPLVDGRSAVAILRVFVAIDLGYATELMSSQCSDDVTVLATAEMDDLCEMNGHSIVGGACLPESMR